MLREGDLMNQSLSMNAEELTAALQAQEAEEIKTQTIHQHMLGSFRDFMKLKRDNSSR